MRMHELCLHIHMHVGVNVSYAFVCGYMEGRAWHQMGFLVTFYPCVEKSLEPIPCLFSYSR